MRPDYLALIAAGGPVLVAITALLLNWWGFSLINKRLDDLRETVNGRVDDLRKHSDTQFAEVSRRLALIEADLKEFFRDIVSLKQKVGL